MFTQTMLDKMMQLEKAVDHPIIDNSTMTVIHENSLMMLCVNDPTVKGMKADRGILDAVVSYYAHCFVEADGDIEFMTFVNDKIGGWIRIIHANRKVDAECISKWALEQGYIQTSKS